MTPIRTTAALAAALLLSAPGLRGQDVHRISGSSVAIYNVAGRARLVRGSGSEVVVRMTRGGSDAARLSVRRSEVRGREALSVVYPSDRIVYPRMGRGRTQMRVRDDGTWGGSMRGGDQIEIRGSGSGMEAWADLVVEVPAGQRVELFVATGEVDAEGVDGDVLIDTGSGAVTATRMSGRLTIDTGSGSVAVRGMRGDLGVDTGSGSVELEDIQADEIVVDTGSGRVRGTGVSSSSLSVDTGSGGIELDGVTATDVVLDTGSGSVEVTLLRDIDRLDIDTGSGSVTVRAPAGLGAEVEIDTGSGGIDVDFPVQVRTVKRDHLVGRIGDGRGRLRIDTSSGGVRLIRN